MGRHQRWSAKLASSPSLTGDDLSAAVLDVPGSFISKRRKYATNS